MYNLIEHSENYSKTPGSLWKYCKGKPNDNLEDPESFKSKMKITRNTPADGNTKDLEIIVPLKYLSTFWNAIHFETVEMPLILETQMIIKLCYY